MGDAFGVRRFAALARDLAAPRSIQQRESPGSFCHGILVSKGVCQLARRIPRDSGWSPSVLGLLTVEPSSNRSTRAERCANEAPLEASTIMSGRSRVRPGDGEFPLADDGA